ncbi:hypothetical protein BCT27_10145 [Enterovibrio norvegicus]|nr:hypothetical protein BCT27_10145 [Enterovibrio norvegicus]
MHPTVKAVRIDGETIKGDDFESDRIQDELTRVHKQTVLGEFNGVVFLSHASLLQTNKHILNFGRVVVDEIPSSAVQLLTLTQTEQTYKHLFQYVQFEPCPKNPKFQKVRLKDDEETQADAIKLVENSVTGIKAKGKRRRDNTFSKEFIQLLKYMLDGFEIIYYTTVADPDSESAGQILHVFQAIVYHPAKHLIESTKDLIILGSNIKDSMFGLVAETVIGAEIFETNVIYGKELTRHHMHTNVRIVPYLTKRNFSKTLKNSMVNTSLVDRETEYKTVVEDIQDFAHQVLGRDYLLFKNEDDKEYYNYESLNVVVRGLHSHGINGYEHITKAAFVGSANPAPDELKLLGVASHELGIGSKTMSKAVLTERYLDPCFQDIGRTAIRNHDELETPCTFVVPDMRAALYLKERIPNAVIDTSLGYERIKQTSPEVQAKRDLAAEAKKQVLISFLLDKRAKVGNLKQLCEKHGISKSSYERYRKDFKHDPVVKPLL